MEQPETVGTVVSLVQFICDDWEMDNLNMATQLPAINSGFREFQRRCAMRDMPFMRNTTVLSVPANTTAISMTSTPPLPDDFVLPLKLREKQVGSNDFFENHDIWRETTLPDMPPGTYLRFYTFEAGQINLLGATVPLSLQIQYQKFFPLLADEQDALPIPYSADPIAHFTALQVALARGVSEEFRARVSAMGEATLDELTSIYVKSEQLQTRRRRMNMPGRF